MSRLLYLDFCNSGIQLLVSVELLPFNIQKSTRYPEDDFTDFTDYRNRNPSQNVFHNFVKCASISLLVFISTNRTVGTEFLPRYRRESCDCYNDFTPSTAVSVISGD